MQDFLTLAIDAIATVSFVYLVAGFAIIAGRTAPLPAALPTQMEVDEIMTKLKTAAEVFVTVEPIATEAEPMIPEVTVPVLEIVQPEAIAIIPAITETTTEPTDWKTLNPFQLRKECTARKIRWRNAASNGKHLKKAEMVRALMVWSGIPEAM